MASASCKTTVTELETKEISPENKIGAQIQQGRYDKG